MGESPKSKRPSARRGARRSTTPAPADPALAAAPEPAIPPPPPPPGFRVDEEDVEYAADADLPLEVEVLREASALREAAEAKHAEAKQAATGAEPALEEQLYEIERQLDRLLRDAESMPGDPEARRRAADALSQIASRLEGASPSDAGEDERLIDTARDLLSTDYYFRQWGRIAMRDRSEEVDEFGLDPTYESRVLPAFETLYRRWFRVSVEGVDQLPAEGRALVVANHSGTLPWDGVMLKLAVRLEHARKRELRWLAEDFVFHMPFLGAFMNRIGAVRACQENAERLLAQQKLVAVFPEGVHGLGKLYRHRYQLQRFGRGGYVKLALRTRTPIFPTAIIGAEETHPLLFKLGAFTKALGVPFIPITPTFPWLGPLGLVPLPSRWKIVIGEPIDLASHGPEGAEDAILVNRLNERIRSQIQSMIDGALATRGGVY